MVKIVGFEAKTFCFDDGKKVDGFYLYTEESRTGVTGVAAERNFISSAKLDGYIPGLGDDVEIYYNRWGKVQKILKTGGSADV